MTVNGLSVGFVMDPLERISPATDTTLGLMLAAQEMGAQIYYMSPDDLYLLDSHAYARALPVTVSRDVDNWLVREEALDIKLGDLDVIMMRKDPPVDKRFIHTTYILAQAVRDGAKVVNDPVALSSYNEKLLAILFPDLCPPTVVTANKDVFKKFVAEHKKAVVKPLDVMGGKGIFLTEADDVNLEVIWEIHSQRGTYPLLAQKFLPEVFEGDCRVSIFDGEPFDHVLVRYPQDGSIRASVSSGGSYKVRPINDQERQVGLQIGRKLAKEGIQYAGIDLVGDKLIEINITSPGILRRMEEFLDVRPCDVLMRKILGRKALAA